MDDAFSSKTSSSHLIQGVKTKPPYYLLEKILQLLHIVILIQAIVFILLKRSQELPVYGFNNKSTVSDPSAVMKCLSCIKKWDGRAYLFLNFQALGFIATRGVYKTLGSRSWLVYWIKMGIEAFVLIGNIIMLILFYIETPGMKTLCTIISGDQKTQRNPLEIPIIEQYVTIGFTSLYVLSNIGYWFLKNERIKWSKSHLKSSNAEYEN